MIFAALTPLLLFPAACHHEPKRPEPPSGAGNVVLVLVDTLRADKLGCLGNTLGLTPEIDALAEQGFLFEQAFSHAPWTLPSMASVLTSNLPARHGAGGKFTATERPTGLIPGVRTLGECFADQGYETGAIVNVFWLGPKFGMHRGFADYDFQPPRKGQKVQRLATEVTDRAIAWIRKKRADSERPFFLMVHYFDPHLTYDPPAAFRKKFALPADYTPVPGLFGTEADMIGLRRGRSNASRLPIRRLERLYNGEIAYTDQEVGRLFDAIDEMGLRESTVVALLADHGEEFLDHGGFEHGHTNYDELLHVPLIIRFPELIKPGRSKATVGLMDVAPTLCSLAGVEAESTFSGRSLESILFGQSTESREVVSEGNMWGPAIRSLRSPRHEGYKLIESAGRLELYRVSEDPHERHDLAKDAAEAERRDTMSEYLAARLKLAEGRRLGKASEVSLTEDEKDSLKGGGYWGE